MTANDIPYMAAYLLEKWGLSQQGWKFSWDRAKRRCGCCHYYRRIIALSKHYVNLNVAERLDDIVDTILHEIAHALAGIGHGHDAVWREKCLLVGARPKRCADAKVALPRGNMVAKCGSCGREFRRHKRPRRTLYCAKCGASNGILSFKAETVPVVSNPPVQPMSDTPPPPRKLRGT